MRSYLIALTLMIALVACNQNSIDTKAEGEKVMQTSREWSKVAATGDIEKTLSYWADDATVLSPGQPALTGKKAIREMLESTSKIPGFTISWEPLIVSVSKSGDMDYMIEQNQITMNDSTGNSIKEFNKSVTIWRKESDGSWKNIVDMWNAEPPQKK